MNIRQATIIYKARRQSKRLSPSRRRILDSLYCKPMNASIDPWTNRILENINKDLKLGVGW